MGALIARAICKKFTVSHTLLSGRPSRVCSALCRHCAGTARTAVCADWRGSALRSARAVRSGGSRRPASRVAASAAAAARTGARRGRRGPHRAPARPPRARGRRQRSANARNAPRPAGGHFAATGRPPPGRADSARADRTAATRDVSYARSRCAEPPRRRGPARRSRRRPRRDPGRSGTASDRRGAGVDG